MVLAMIKAIELTKRFGSVTAVNNVNLAISKGELFGFLGPNGAGKTTTIKMLTGLLKPTEGRVEIGGFDIAKEPLKAKSLFGYVPDQPNVYDKLTAREFLTFIADLYRVDGKTRERKLGDLLQLMELEDRGDELIQGYSHGMKQKVAIAGALIHDPRVIFLDEPTVGLDPKSARKIKDILRELCNRGVTIFMSTHILEIAERMCDRVGIINKGDLVAVGTVEELRHQARGENSSLEDIFLQITGGSEHEDVIGFLGG
ncbi:MAG: ABC transporter ATP-binding protein [Actinobacteria bacterium]|nr:ABC transporter ATP-binding protein [Actinomycetota bacterium]